MDLARQVGFIMAYSASSHMVVFVWNISEAYMLRQYYTNLTIIRITPLDSQESMLGSHCGKMLD